MHSLIKYFYSVSAAGLLVVASYAGAAQGAGSKPANPMQEAAAKCEAECKPQKKEDGAFERCVVKCMDKQKSARQTMPKY